MSKRSSTETMPYALVYGHDVVLHLEITVQSLRVANQNKLSHIEYEETIMFEMDDLDERELEALYSIIFQKEKVADVHNRKVKAKSFHKGELI